jgi:hypothetical protein
MRSSVLGTPGRVCLHASAYRRVLPGSDASSWSREVYEPHTVRPAAVKAVFLLLNLPHFSSSSKLRTSRNTEGLRGVFQQPCQLRNFQLKKSGRKRFEQRFNCCRLNYVPPTPLAGGGSFSIRYEVQEKDSSLSLGMTTKEAICHLERSERSQLNHYSLARQAYLNETI